MNLKGFPLLDAAYQKQGADAVFDHTSSFKTQTLLLSSMIFCLGLKVLNSKALTKQTIELPFSQQGYHSNTW